MKKYIIAFFIAVLLTSASEASVSFPVYSLSVSFDLERNLLRGKALITLDENRVVKISLGDLRVLSVKVNNQPAPPEAGPFIELRGGGTAEIEYEMTLPGAGGPAKAENAGVVSTNLISVKGISLTRSWYPALSEMALYHLDAQVPEGFTAVSEAEDVAVSSSSGGRRFSFSFPNPLRGITLAAGNYRELRESFNGVDIYVYLSAEDAALEKKYAEYAKKYIGMYSGLLTPYPYKRFSIVENILPTGYSMPTFTLLGRDVLRLPFIAETALGHEVLHQWFGNSVYVDYSEGNWSEGLTAYLSDHLYEDRKGNGALYRKNILTDYASYVHDNKVIALRDFTMRTDFASKAVGYGKGAMVFHMLRKLLGDEGFSRAVRDLAGERRFQETSWDDIKDVFEKVSGRDLGSFFSQWVDRKGIPDIAVKDPAVTVVKGVPTVSFQVVQGDEPYSLDLPVRISTDKGALSRNIHVEKTRETVSIPLDGNPTEMAVDPDYDVMRRMPPEEVPPVISRLLGDSRRLVAIPDEHGEVYASLIEIFRGKGFEAKDETDVTDEDIRSSSLLVFGGDSPVLKRLFGKMEETGAGFSMNVRRNPLNSARVVAVVLSSSKEETDSVGEKIFHYGKYSSLRFEKGKNTEKNIRAAEQGMRFILDGAVRGIQPRQTMNLDEIISRIYQKPVIYIGERHGNYEDHKIELRVIMELHKYGRKFAIGMEMFQRPFQKAINDYLAGDIDERQFLKSTEYFKRWQFDYNLYREIIEFAKAKKIPIVALNQWSEITRKVAKEGLDSLDNLERREIPDGMDMADDAYRNLLSMVFRSHVNRDSAANFEFFYQSQVLWDETMAQTADEYLKKNPDYQLVVLAGAGHIMHGYGIPKRMWRLNSKPFVTLLASSQTPEREIADYVLFPEPLRPPVTLKLGVVLKETEGGLRVVDIIPGSRLREAGVKKDDILVSLDDWQVENVEDVRIFMFDKKEGDPVRLKVLRKKFLAGYQPMEFSITL